MDPIAVTDGHARFARATDSNAWLQSKVSGSTPAVAVFTDLGGGREVTADTALAALA
jgi:hypothetical protein